MKVSSAVLGIGLVAASGLAFHFWRELEEGRQQIAILTTKLQERQPPTVASAVSDTAQTFTVTGQPSQTSTESHLSESPNASDPPPKGLDFASVRARAETPEGRAQTRSTARHMVESTYPGIDQALALTADESDRLFDLLVTQSVRGTETAVPEQESAGDREARWRKRRETEAAEVQALLGSKYPKWQDYQETVSVWEQRRDLRAVLDAASIPLTQMQDRALINALSAEQRGIDQTGASTTRRNANGFLVPDYSPDNRQRLLDAAAPYLSPQQLDGYKGLLERKAQGHVFHSSSLQKAAAAFSN